MKYTKLFLLPELSWSPLCFIKQHHETEAFPRIFTVVICTAWDFQLPPGKQTAVTLEQGDSHLCKICIWLFLSTNT